MIAVTQVQEACYERMERALNKKTVVLEGVVLKWLCFFIMAAVLFGRSYGKTEYYGNIETKLQLNNNILGRVTNQFEGSVSFAQNMRVVLGETLGFVRLTTSYLTNHLSLSLDRAYVQYRNDWGKLKIGKDRPLKGVGYMWNPSDILNPARSLLYHDDERRREDRGILLSSMSLFGAIGLFSFNVQSLVVPETRIEKTKGVSSLYLQFGAIETAFRVGYQRDRRSIFAGYLRTSIPYFDYVTLYGEFQCVGFETNFKYMAGMQINPPFSLFDGNLQLQFEYYRNEDGYKNMRDYFRRHPRSFPPVADVLQNYIYGGISYKTRVFHLIIGATFNLDDDQSGIVNMLASYNFTDDSKISLGGYYTIAADDEREFRYLTMSRFRIYLGLDIYFYIGEKEV